MSKEKSKLDYLYDNKQKEVTSKGVMVHEEFIAHGEKGLSFKFYHKAGGKIMKVSGRRNDDGTYSVKMTHDDKTEEKNMSKKEFLEEFGKDKDLKFAADYIKQNGGKRRGSRKGSKKGSKKGSRKGSRKQSGGKRRGSRKGSKKGSKKGSRKQSGGKRRGSRKGSNGSKKGSKKGSRKGSKKGSKRYH